MRSETMIDRQPRGRQPEFGIKTAFCNVNVRRLIAFFSVEAVAQQTQGLRPRIGAQQGPIFVMSVGIMIPEADLLEAYPRLKHADIQAALAERTCLRMGSGAVQGARKRERLIEKEDGAAVQSRARICLRIM